MLSPGDGSPASLSRPVERTSSPPTRSPSPTPLRLPSPTPSQTSSMARKKSSLVRRTSSSWLSLPGGGGGSWAWGRQESMEDPKLSPPPVPADVATIPDEELPAQERRRKSSSLPPPRLLRVVVSGDEYELPSFRGRKGQLRRVTWAQPPLLDQLSQPNLTHAQRAALCDRYEPDTLTCHFYRSPMLFQAIFHYHVTGVLFCPAGVCPERFRHETIFWRVDFHDCANLPKIQRKDLAALSHASDEASRSRYLLAKGSDAILEEIRANNPAAQILDLEGEGMARFRRQLWLLLEMPASSRLARGLEILSVLLILISLLTLVTASHSSFQKPRMHRARHICHSKRRSCLLKYLDPVRNVTVIDPTLEHIEAFCIAYFTAEYTIRFIISPQRIFFVKNFYNIVDFLSIFPFYFEHALHILGVTDNDFRTMVGALLALSLLRLLRVARVLKLLRHSRSTKFLVAHIQDSSQELGTLLLLFTSLLVGKMAGALLALSLLRLLRVARVLKLLRHSRSTKFLVAHIQDSSQELGTLLLLFTSLLVGKMAGALLALSLLRLLRVARVLKLLRHSRSTKFLVAHIQDSSQELGTLLLLFTSLLVGKMAGALLALSLLRLLRVARVLKLLRHSRSTKFLVAHIQDSSQELGTLLLLFTSLLVGKMAGALLALSLLRLLRVARVLKLLRHSRSTKFLVAHIQDSSQELGTLLLLFTSLLVGKMAGALLALSLLRLLRVARVLKLLRHSRSTKFLVAHIQDSSQELGTLLLLFTSLLVGKMVGALLALSLLRLLRVARVLKLLRHSRSTKFLVAHIQDSSQELGTLLLLFTSLLVGKMAGALLALSLLRLLRVARVLKLLRHSRSTKFLVAHIQDSSQELGTLLLLFTSLLVQERNTDAAIDEENSFQ